MNKSSFTYDPDTGIYIGGSTVPYADGSEEFFYNLFNTEDVTDKYNLVKFIKDWPTKYHLSPERAYVVSPFEELFNTRGRVLEIGAGMGAVTRYLGERFSAVDCIEGSTARAKALRARTRDMKHIDIYAADASQADLGTGQYDLATLIGVLEYIPVYTNAPAGDSITAFLSKIKDALTENGVLLIAIENKFGIKYLAGCREDHNGGFFTGITDYPNKSPLTFGRNELEELIKKSGFDNIQFYHAFPDYKIPESTYLECADVYKLNPDIFYPSQVIDNQSRQQLFIEPLMAHSLYKEKMNHFFSNSFIVLCSKNRDINLKTRWVYIKNSPHIIKPENKYTVRIIPESGRDGFIVERVPMNPDMIQKNSGYFTLTLPKKRKYIHGSPLSIEAYKAIAADDNYEALTNLLREIKQELINHSTGKDDDGYELIGGQYFDFCFRNIIRRDNKLICFDSKWVFNTNLPIDYIILRNILDVFGNVMDYRFRSGNDFDSALTAVLYRLFPQYNNERLSFISTLETNLTNKIINR